MIVRAEFTVEPFVAGSPGQHVMAALDAVRVDGVEVEFGPFGTSMIGDASHVIDAVAAAVSVAFEHGAERVSAQFTIEPDT